MWVTHWQPAGQEGWRHFYRRSQCAEKLHKQSSKHEREGEETKSETHCTAMHFWGLLVHHFLLDLVLYSCYLKYDLHSENWSEYIISISQHLRKTEAKSVLSLMKIILWVSKHVGNVTGNASEAWPYSVPEWVGFNGILSSQWNTTEDDEDEDEVGEVGVMDEVVAGDS